MTLNGYRTLIPSFKRKPPTGIRQVLLPACGMVLALLLGLAWLGFPGFLTRWILSDINEGNYYVEAHNLRLDLRGGLKASNVSIYRKGVVGPPFLEARELKIVFRLLERPRAGVSRIKGLQVKGGVIRPDGGPAFLMPDAGIAGRRRGAEQGVKNARQIMNLEVMFRDFEVMGVYVDPLHAGVQVGSEGVRLAGVSGFVGRDMQRGAVDGHMAWTWNRQATGRLVTTFDPRALIPPGRSFYPAAASLLEQFSFSGTPPRLDFSFETDMGKAWSFRAKGRIQASRYAYRGAGVGFANVMVEYACSNGVNRLTLDPFLIVAGGRQAEGRAGFDFTAGTADFDVTSAIDLATVLRLSGIKEQALESWHLEEGARVTARGCLDYKAPERSVVEASVEGSRIGFSRIDATDYGFRFSAGGRTSQFSEVHGKIGNGSFSGSAVLIPEASGSTPVRHVQVELIHVDAEEVLAGLTADPKWRTDGQLYGNVDLADSGSGTSLTALSGRGQATLRNSQIFKLPLFVNLAGELTRAFPGLDFMNSRADVHVSYEVRNGRIVIRELQVDDGPVIVTAAGTCGLDGTLDFSVKVQLMKKSESLVRAIAGMFTAEKGMEFTLGGTLGSPQWMATQRR